MAAPISWAPGKNAFFLQEKCHVHKIPRFRGGVFWVLGGGKCRFYFYGREDFSDIWTRGASKIEKMPSSRYRYEDLISSKRLFPGAQTSGVYKPNRSWARCSDLIVEGWYVLRTLVVGGEARDHPHEVIGRVLLLRCSQR